MIKLTLALLLILTKTSILFGQDTDPSLRLENHLQAKINEVVRQYDNYARVIVEIKAKKVTQKLPTTPLLIENFIVRSKDNKIEIEKAKVTVLSHANDLPSEIKTIIIGFFKDYNVEPEIQISKPPKSMGLNIDYLTQELTKPSMFYFYLGCVLFFFLTLVFLIFKKRSEKYMASLVQQSLNDLKNIFEDSSYSSSRDSSKLEGENARNNQAINADSGSENSKIIGELNIDSLKALFSDCYWTSNDNYAAYLWRSSPIDKREEVIENSSYLKNYAKYISNIDDKIALYHQDPYYLKSLAIDHLSNFDLTKIVEKYPEIYNHLPKMRLDSLDLSIKQRIKALAIKSSGVELRIQQVLMNTKASTEREIKVRNKILIQSIEEEQEALSIESPSFDLMEDIVMLSWAKALDVESLKHILKEFSAQELASAWVASTEVLDLFKKSIPEKKMILIESYILKNQPSRNSQAYKRLHSLIINEIKKESKLENTNNIESKVSNVA